MGNHSTATMARMAEAANPNRASALASMSAATNPIYGKIVSKEAVVEEPEEVEAPPEPVSRPPTAGKKAASKQKVAVEEPVEEVIEEKPAEVETGPPENLEEALAAELPVSEGKLFFSKADAEEPWSRHGVWNIPIYWKRAEEDNAMFSEEEEEKTKRDANKIGVRYLQVETVAVERVLSATPRVVQFGQLVLGGESVISVTLRNLAATPTFLRMKDSCLNPYGPFTILNSLRPLPPGGSMKLLVRFAPTLAHRVNEAITLQADTGVVTINLLGRGVEPSLVIDPPDGELYLGHLMAGGTVSRTLTVSNSSQFPLTYSLEPLSTPPGNFCNLPVFSCVPAQATLEAGASRKVAVYFNADHQLEHEFSVDYALRVAGQKAVQHKLRIHGRCWAREMFAVSEEEERAHRSAPVSLADPISSLLANPLCLPAVSSAAGSSSLSLYFPKPSDPECAESEDGKLRKKVVVGNAHCGGGILKAASGSFEITFPAEGAGLFAADPAKGTLAEGSLQTVDIVYSPPEEFGKEDATSSTAGVGQWVECVAKCVLKGGAVPPGCGDTQTVDISLQRFVPVNSA